MNASVTPLLPFLKGECGNACEVARGISFYYWLSKQNAKNMNTKSLLPLPSKPYALSL
jgi:hypothetical protein